VVDSHCPRKIGPRVYDTIIADTYAKKTPPAFDMAATPRERHHF